MRLRLAPLIASVFLGALIAGLPAVPADAESLFNKAKRTITKGAKQIVREAEKAIDQSLGVKKRVIVKRAPAPGSYGVKPKQGTAIGLSAAEGPPGAEITLEASGLPRRTQFTIGAGPDAGNAEFLADAKSSSKGEIVAVVNVPGDAGIGDSLVFVVESADGEVRLVSDSFLVAEASAEPDGSGGQTGEAVLGDAPESGQGVQSGGEHKIGAAK